MQQFDVFCVCRVWVVWEIVLFLLVVILFMTPQDLKQIGNVIDKKFDERFGEQNEKINERFDKFGKSIIGYVKNKLEIYTEEQDSKLFKWKSDVIDAVDALASEMKDSQDFRQITTHQIVTNRERTDRLEKQVFGVVTSV